MALLTRTAPEVIVLDRSAPTSGTAPSAAVIVAPLSEWARAVRLARTAEAASYRYLIDPLDGDPSWEDAEWR